MGQSSFRSSFRVRVRPWYFQSALQSMDRSATVSLRWCRPRTDLRAPVSFVQMQLPDWQLVLQ
jgi:hypothetical protein